MAATMKHRPEGDEWRPTDTFGARLALLRQAMGWNITQAAEACGQNEETWRGWEKFDRSPRKLTSVARAIADATGCSYSWLMLGGELAKPLSGWVPGLIPGWEVFEGEAQLTLFGGADVSDVAARRLDELVYAERDDTYVIDLTGHQPTGLAA